MLLTIKNIVFVIFFTSSFILNLLNVSAFVTTHIELKLIANAAIIGFSNIPSDLYSTPHASGIPIVL